MKSFQNKMKSCHFLILDLQYLHCIENRLKVSFKPKTKKKSIFEQFWLLESPLSQTIFLYPLVAQVTSNLLLYY